MQSKILNMNNHQSGLRYPFEDDDDEFEPLVEADSSSSSGSESGSDDDSYSVDDNKDDVFTRTPESISIQRELLPKVDLPSSDTLKEPSTSHKRPIVTISMTTMGCLFLFAVLVAAVAGGSPSLVLPADENESIYVPGVGFSGFWFTLGRLKSIPDPSSKNYVCFSAGCLGAVTILNNFTVDEMACMAESAQIAWKSGNIGRYDVVRQFVDGLVYRDQPKCIKGSSSSYNGGFANSTNNIPIDNPHLLSKLHILTTTTRKPLGVKAIMRSPTSLDDLREMLIQTTWIPLATGNGLQHNGHMDGGFSLLQHPKCTKSVTLPFDAGLILNSLNVNMGVDEAYRLWNDGLAYGL